jgi:hypothetical protein
MKKIVLYSCIGLLSVACKKNNSDNSSANTWHFAGKAYSAAAVIYLDAGGQSNLSATASGYTATSAEGLVFTFMTPPTSSTQMLIDDSGDANTVVVSTSKLSGTTTTFYSNDVTNVTANVTVNNGKVGVSFPGNIWLHNLADYNDSAQLSISTITEQ